MERLNVAVFPTGGSGHVNPMLELSRHLVPLGFAVRFLVPEDSYSKMILRPQEEHIQLVSFAPIPQQNLHMSPELEDHVAEVLQNLQPPVQCLISDAFLGWSRNVAKRLGIPRVTFWTAKTTAEALCFNLLLLDSKGFIPASDDPSDSRLITFLPGFGPIHPSRLPFSFRQKDPFLTVLGQSLQDDSKEALCILTNAVEELEQELVISRRSLFAEYLPVGPMISAAFLRNDHDQGAEDQILDCIRFLDQQAPCSVLYVAFGSVVKLPIEQVEKIAQALESNRSPFVWAIRRDFAIDAAEGLLESLQKRFGEQGLILEWAPQASVLGHSSIGAFFTHCGWNSTLEAICSGVPMLCWPCKNDQNTNCIAIVEQWKIGVKVAEGPRDAVTPGAIEAAIRSVMGTELRNELRSRIQVLKSIVRKAFQGGCSEKNLLRFRELLRAAASEKLGRTLKPHFQMA